MSIRNSDFNLDPDSIAKKALLAALFKKVPNAKKFESRIKFKKQGTKLTVDLSGLPESIVAEINRKFLK